MSSVFSAICFGEPDDAGPERPAPVLTGDHRSRALRGALDHARDGLPVFLLHGIRDGGCTCRGRSKRCKPGKHPRTRHGFHDATTEPDAIGAAFARFPDSNYGIPTGRPSGRVVLDVDGIAGEDSLRRLEREMGELPATLEIVTPRGGRHLGFSYTGDDIGSSQGALGRGLDVRGRGGYVVGPGSLGANGSRYEVLRDAPPAPLPDALRRRLLALAAPDPCVARAASPRPTKSRKSACSSGRAPFTCELYAVVPPHVVLRDILGVPIHPDRETNVRCVRESDHRRVDRHKSASVNGRTGLYKCFRCGDGLDPVTLLVTLGRATNKGDAIRKLCETYLGERGELTAGDLS